MNFAIIGAGVIARDFAQAANIAAAQQKNITLYAVAARELPRAQAFAKDFSIPVAYGSYDEVFNDPKVDAVYIAVTHNFHTALTQRAATHGKAILCEKPFALSETEAAETIAFVREKNVLLMEAMWTRFLPSICKAREWIAAGRIGKVNLIEASFSFYSERDPESRLYHPALAGGALLDVGVYPLAFALDFAASPVAKATAALHLGPTGVDEMNTMSLLFENGVVAALSSGIRANTRQDARVYGEEGYLHLPTFWGGNRAHLFDRAGKQIDTFTGENTTRPQGFVYQILHFADLFAAGKTESPLMPLAHTLSCARLFDTLR